MKQNTRLYALVAVAALLGVITILVYLPAPQAANSNLPTQNYTAAYSSFAKEYGFQNLSTGLFNFYGSPSNNSIVFDCRYEITPQLLNIPAGYSNQTAESLYNSITADIGIATFCSVNESLPLCSQAYKNLSNYMINDMNYSYLYAIYNQTRASFYSLYLAANSSGIANLSIFNPVKYDINLLNSTQPNTSAIVSALLNLKELPESVLLEENGSVAKSDVYAFGPFQFKLKYIPAARSCNAVFNLMVQPSSETPAFSQISASLSRKTTNICVQTPENQCNSSEMSRLNASFYVS